MQTYQPSTLTINYKIATKAEWNQWNRTESLDAHVHQWREVGLQTGRDRPGMRLGQLFVHTSEMYLDSSLTIQTKITSR